MFGKRVVVPILMAGVLLFVTSLCRAQQNAAPADTDEQRIADLVTAYRICVNEGILDSFGHMSVRSVKNPNHFYIPRALPPALVTAKDMVEMDLDGKPVDPKAPRTNGERFIHSEIYKARPDVQAVLHAHSSQLLPFPIAGVPLRPVIAQAGFLPPETPVFEVRDAYGPVQGRGMLVTSPKIGAALAKALGKNPVILLRGHGSAVVGDSVRQLVVYAAYTDIDARAQLAAMQLNKNIMVLDSPELAAYDKEQKPDRPWAAFANKAGIPVNYQK